MTGCLVLCCELSDVVSADMLLRERVRVSDKACVVPASILYHSEMLQHLAGSH